MKAKSGFTLVEILIVVVILGILAAIVIPQFTGASTEAKESSLRSNLQAIRSQIELYKIQHNADILPGEILDAATGDISAATAVLFVTALTSNTDKNGVVGAASATYRYGPYMRRIPVNPFSTCDNVTTLAGISEDDSSVLTGATKLAAGGNASGWFFVANRDAVTGQALTDHGLFQAADSLANPLDATDLHVDY